MTKDQHKSEIVRLMSVESPSGAAAANIKQRLIQKRMESIKEKGVSFKKGDRIIWNSHFGYDIGYFIGEGVMYYTYSVEIVTGKYPGQMSLPVYEIHAYSEDLVDDLIKEYGYERRFAKDF